MNRSCGSGGLCVPRGLSPDFDHGLSRLFIPLLHASYIGDSLLESKESLRLRMKAARDSLAQEQVLSRSLEIGRRLLESSLLKDLSSVALYASVRNEVSTEWISRQLKSRQCATHYPRLVAGGIEFIAVEDLALLTPGRWGIPEPAQGQSVSLKEIEAVLMPGLAFDETGARLGWGRGYFDRALEPFRGRKIGLAYDFQVLPSVPRGEKDLACHWIVTETRVIRGTAAREES